MAFISSLKKFSKVFADDSALTSLGASRGWLLRMHYRGRWAARQKQSPPSERVTILVREKLLNIELSAAYEGAFMGVFLDNEYDCISLLKKPVLKILDLGANIGMGSIYLATQFSDAEFICVEPDPRNLSLLERNIAANGIRSSVVAAAVGAASGQLRLRFGDNPTCSALETSPMHLLESSISIPVKTVTDVLDEKGWDTVDLVKIDIEGTEDELLSMNNSWLERAQALIMEIHPNTTPERIASFIKPFGFELKRIGWGSEPVYFAGRKAQ